jgi:NitT/TauT family transport system ATP-binding protein
VSSSVIAVNALTKRYAARTGTVSALEEISFSVDEGEFVAVVGPSGCGESTLLKILAGILPSSAGEARLRGTTIAGPRKDIGVVFQAPVLFPWRSVLDNVLLPIDVQGLGREGHRQDAMDLLTSWGCRASRGAIHGSCREACSSAWPSRGPSCTIPPSSSWTSPSGLSTR